MVTVPTLFVLGAGASIPYGYPSGKGLRRKIVEDLEPDLDSHFNKDSSLDSFEKEQYKEKAKKLMNVFGNAPIESIDKFLALNPSFEDIGKLAIAFLILEYEKKSSFNESLKKPNQDWYSHLFNQMTSSFKSPDDYMKFKDNKVSFITFNYDRSLEHVLLSGFRNAFYDNRGQIEMEMVDISSWHENYFPFPLIHVYGQIGEPGWLWGRDYREMYDFQKIKTYSKGIRVIGERTENSNDKIGKMFAEAKKIYFLGFGYADENLEAIGIKDNLREDHDIYGTAFDSTDNEMERIKRKLIVNPASMQILTNPHIEKADSLKLFRTHPLI